MNSSRSYLNFYQNDTIENSLLEWIESFSIEYAPNSFDDIYKGVALYEVLNKIDMLFWPKSKLVQVPSTEQQCSSNFKHLISGLEKFYQEKLDSMIHGQTSNIDCEQIVLKKDFNFLLDLIELIMGVVINCEEKQQYIEQILNLDDKTQEDLKKLIEKSINRLSMEFAEPSMVSDSTVHLEMQRSIDNLEKEKKLLREKIVDIENELKTYKRDNKEKDEAIKNLDHQVQQLQYEKDIRKSSEYDFSGLKGMGQLEAQLTHSQKEIHELQGKMNDQKNHYKVKIKELKEEIQMQKEKIMKQQKSDALANFYKGLEGELEEAKLSKTKLKDLEERYNQQSLDNIKLQHQQDQFKSAYEQIKKQIQEIQNSSTSEALELEKCKTTIKELEESKKKIEKKHQALNIKYENTLESYQALQAKLEVIEEKKNLTMLSRNNLDDFESDDMYDRVSILEQQKKELENENHILKMSNQSELNNKVLEMESQIFEIQKEKEKIKQQLELKEQKIAILEEEIDVLRGQADKDSDSREQKNDLSKELLKLKVERDQWKEKFEKAIKKLENKKQLELELKAGKEEKLKLEEEIRKIHKEKAEDKEQYLKIKEEKIKLESSLINLESKLSTLTKDNQTLELSLEQYKHESQKVKSNSSETHQEFQILRLEKERDQLKWAQEKQEMQNKIHEYNELNKSKDYEFKIREEQLKQKYKDDIQSQEESIREQVDELKQTLKQREANFKLIEERSMQQDVENNRVNSFISSQFYNLAYEHNKVQKEGKTFSWLDRQRQSVYNIKYNQIYGPN